MGPLGHINDELYEALKAAGAIITKPSLEFETEEGNGYALTIEIAIPNGSTSYYLLRTPVDKVVRIKSRTVTTGGALRYTPYISSTFVLGSEITNTYIRNLKSGGDPSSAQLFNVTSVSDAGIPIDVVRTPSTQGSSDNSGTYGADGAERILGQGTDYLLEFENIDNGSVWCVYSLVATITEE